MSEKHVERTDLVNRIGATLACPSMIPVLQPSVIPVLQRRIWNVERMSETRIGAASLLAISGDNGVTRLR